MKQDFKIHAIYNVAIEFNVNFDPERNKKWYVRYGILYIENPDGSETEVEPLYEIEDAHDFKDPQRYVFEDVTEVGNTLEEWLN